jgi:hypothetical protein
MNRGFYGWSFVALMAAYEKAMREGQVFVRQTPMREDDLAERIIVTGVDVGSPDGDHTTHAYRGVNGIDFVIIDDPYAESRPVYEGEFHVVEPRMAMSTYVSEIEEAKLIAHAPSTEKNKGPQPRTKYPRRR